MILYHAISSFQLLEEVVLRKKYSPIEKSVLIISHDVVNRIKNYEGFFCFFDDILEYDNGNANQIVSSSIELISYFDSIFMSKSYRISDFDKIYIACAHHSFGIYVAQQNIPYIFIEDGIGALSRPEILQNIEKHRRKKHCLALQYGLYDGSGESAIACIYNRYFQIEGFEQSDRYIHFDVYEALSSMKANEREYLINIFTKITNIPCEKHAVLFLTEHFANLRIFSWEEQILLYQLVVDYFFDDYALVFKPHPDDLMYYEELFPESYVIKGRFPSEILPFLFAQKPELIATVSSTSIYSLKECFDNTISFNFDFSHNKRQFKDLHRMYVALKIAENISNDTIYLYAFNQVIADNFITLGKIKVANVVQIKELDEFNETPQGSVLIIDNCPYYTDDDEKSVFDFLNRISNDKTVIFINSANDNCFYYHEKKVLCKYIYQVKIEKELQCDVCYDLTESEYVFCFCKDGLKFTKISYVLQYTGISVNARQLEGTESSIQLLINLLNAMNTRLANSLKDNKRYRELLSESEAKSIPVFKVDYDFVKDGYSIFDSLEGCDEQNFRIVKGMLFAVERRYLYITEENKYLEKFTIDR